MADQPETILVVAAHPDDCDAGCGGSCARWAAEGYRVVLCVATNGEKGSELLEMTSAKLVELRDEEQREAAKQMGISEVIILPNADGELEDTIEFRGQLVRLIRKYKPFRVVTHNPFQWQHRDHRMSGQVSLDATYPYARDRLHFPELEQEGLTPHKVREVYLFAGFNSDKYDTEVDITDFLDSKLNALASHVSQFGPAEETKQRWRERWSGRMKDQEGRFFERFIKVEFPV